MKDAETLGILAVVAVVAFLAWKGAPEIIEMTASNGGGMDAFDDLFQKAAAKYGISDWKILKAIAWNESSVGTNSSVAHGIANPSDIENSVSSDGLSWGIMQTTLATAQWLRPGTTEEDLNNPEISIDLGAKYIAYLLNRFGGDVSKAVMAYNEGPGNVDAGKTVDTYLSRFQSHYNDLTETA